MCLLNPSTTLGTEHSGMKKRIPDFMKLPG